MSDTIFQLAISQQNFIVIIISYCINKKKWGRGELFIFTE